jgi:hypothetical protein
VPKRVLQRMDESTEMTKGNRRMTFTVAFNYGGRAEIVDAVKALIDDGVPARKVDVRALRKRMYAPEMPDPDLVIRTSGEFRLSNFLIWEVAYSELVFTDVLWPDFRRQHLAEAIREFQRRDRRFGGTVRPSDVEVDREVSYVEVDGEAEGDGEDEGGGGRGRGGTGRVAGRRPGRGRGALGGRDRRA